MRPSVARTAKPQDSAHTVIPYPAHKPEKVEGGEVEGGVAVWRKLACRPGGVSDVSEGEAKQIHAE